MGLIQTIANQFRTAAAAREESAATQLVEFYGSVYEQLQASLEAVTRKIIEAQKAGTVVSPAWIYQQARLAETVRMVEQQVTDFATFADRNISASQLDAIKFAQSDSRAMILASLGPTDTGTVPLNFLRFNPSHVNSFIGRSSDGSPLSELLKELAGEQVQALRAVFVEGIIRGNNPTVIARVMAKEFEVPKNRALTISRTEVLNSYRDTTQDFMRQNSDIVIRWRWVCAHQDKTCAMCLAMDGREFPTKIDMGTHPNCRCCLMPITKTWEELGYKSAGETSARKTETGAEWFARQSEKSQLKVLGPEKFERYKDGKLSLQDTIGYKDNSKWGEQRWERSLKQIDSDSYAPPAALLGTY